MINILIGIIVILDTISIKMQLLILIYTYILIFISYTDDYIFYKNALRTHATPGMCATILMHTHIVVFVHRVTATKVITIFDMILQVSILTEICKPDYQ
jgi:hypothetical protein